MGDNEGEYDGMSLGHFNLEGKVLGMSDGIVLEMVVGTICGFSLVICKGELNGLAGALGGIWLGNVIE